MFAFYDKIQRKTQIQMLSVSKAQLIHVKDNIYTARKQSCGKVMFLQVSVILFTGGCLLPERVPAPGGVPGPGGCLVLGGLVEIPGTATAAGGTHPTGMHSCSEYIYFKLLSK